MPDLVLFARPWWVNLFFLVPAAPFFLPQQMVRLHRKQLLIAALFGIAFGFVEAAVVVYLRAAIGLSPGPPTKALSSFPQGLLKIECFREAATMIMLGSIAQITGRNICERIAAFLWTFAFWDIFYYVWLRVTIGWPAHLNDTDILFLIPVPWIAQVWFPLLVSSLAALAVWLRCSTGTR
jgi:hypothetical protein